jgi:hypothetical protein
MNRDIHIFLRAGLRNLCGARASIRGGEAREPFAVDAYPRALFVDNLELPLADGNYFGWGIVFNYGEAMHEAVPVDTERFCQPCNLIHSVMKANKLTSRRAARRLLKAQGGMK